MDNEKRKGDEHTFLCHAWAVQPHSRSIDCQVLRLRILVFICFEDRKKRLVIGTTSI